MAIALIGGGHKQEPLQRLYRYIVKNTTTPLRIAIIPFASHTMSIYFWKHKVKSIFKPYGIEAIRTISTYTPLHIAKKIVQSSNVLYFTGGKPDLLIERIIEMDLVEIINNHFHGHLIGYSAGALALCQKCLITRDYYYSKTKVMSGLGFVPFTVEVHYQNTRENEVKRLALNRSIVALQNGSGVVIDNEDLIPFGDVFIFGHFPSLNMY